MDLYPSESTPDHPGVSTLRRLGWALCLILLAPTISHIHFGAVPATNVFALIPAIFAWGVGSLLVREIALRIGKGWTTRFTLALALALAEECLFIQTSFYPLIGVDPNHAYGRFAGVNWTYLLWSLGYEAIYAVLLPLWLMDWMFPAGRQQAWLKPFGLMSCLVVFIVAGILRWYAWTQHFIPQFAPSHAIHPDINHVLAAAFAVITLVVLSRSNWYELERGRYKPGPKLNAGTLCILSFGFAAYWFLLLFNSYGIARWAPFQVMFGLGLGAGIVAHLLMDRLVQSVGWRDYHESSIALGLSFASMISGYFILANVGANMIDYSLKAVVNVLLSSLLIYRLSLSLRLNKSGIRSNT